MEKSRPHFFIKESGWTVEDYYRLPEDGNQYEIVGGRLELKPSPSTNHQRISYQLERAMANSCEKEYIIMHAQLDVVLNDHETRQPDILMIHCSREHIIQEHAVVGPPDLVVEIISPNSAKRDRTMKKESYARFGVPEYWIADPANITIEQYVLVEEGRPYELLQVFAGEDMVHSERIPCLGFLVEHELKLK